MPIKLKSRKVASKAKQAFRPYETSYVWLEMPTAVVRRIDDQRKKLDVPMSRVRWITEACVQALEAKSK